MSFAPYPNISAKSPNGGYRLEITGTPGNDFFRDQSSFVYRLFRSDKLAWEWPAGQKESGGAVLHVDPHAAWVSDGGWVVVRTNEWLHAGLLVFSPDGKVVLPRESRRL